MLKKIKIESNGNKLKGKILYPANYVEGNKVPLVIVSHGFCSCMKDTKSYAEVFVEMGYAAIIYDFCMSGFRCKSSGKSTGMSVLTQKADLLNLFEYVKTLDFVDLNHIVLAGCSQGGFVSSLASVELEDQIKGLVMYYPALCIPDDCRSGNVITAHFDPNQVPETFKCIFMKLSRKYVDDGKSLDPYKEICGMKKPVLIIHGIEDDLVKIDYSRKAAEGYADCKLVEIHGDHGFFKVKGSFEESAKFTKEWLKERMGM